MSNGEQLLLDHIEKTLALLERAPRMFGGPRVIESLGLMLIEVRQMLCRPSAALAKPNETSDAYSYWITAINGESTSCMLVDVLRDGDMLEQLPKLMGDFGRWVALKYPAESKDGNE